ncbi:MAG: agmatine deiminase family protein [Candidatus Eisenbacteria bacterium]|nr:agmatine deiminase family protein [Candidatus Eisenbacteria bacterium]
MLRLYFRAMLLSLGISILLSPWTVRAESVSADPNDPLPIGMTPEEERIWDAYKQTRDLRVDPPPTAPVRNCAEWEPCTGVLIGYPSYFGLPASLFQDFDDVVTIHIAVPSSYYNSCVNWLVSNGIDTSKVEFLVEPLNSIWTRDYGPWFVFDGNGDIGIVDHEYNRPRADDNRINGYFGAQQGIPVYAHGMDHTGGNYMTDGAHISMSTDLVYDEAGMSEAAVDQLMEDYLGITTYNVVDDISSSGIHHIDTWGKFLDEETVLIKEVWTSHYTYAALEQRATLIASLQSSTGRNYTVHRVYCYSTSSGPASYTNSLILNDKIYVPFFGNSTYDNQAIAAYQAAAPGYDVEGYYYSGFLDDDALHCRTKGVMDRGMLRVSHIPIREEMTGPVAVTAFVDDRSETGLSAVELHYRFSGDSWQTVAMTALGGDYYEGEIPNPASDTTVDYYIHAEDNDGRAEGMPRVEPAAYYTFSILRGIDTGAGEAGVPAVTVLHPNRPNPFNPQTTFRFDLKYEDHVELTVFDVRGRAVRHLVDGARDAGSHEVVWDGRDDRGRELSSGVYYYRLRAAGVVYTRPAVLVR